MELCRQCTCRDFFPNVWRPSMCSNCMHARGLHRAPGGPPPPTDSKSSESLVSKKVPPGRDLAASDITDRSEECDSNSNSNSEDVSVATVMTPILSGSRVRLGAMLHSSNTSWNYHRPSPIQLSGSLLEEEGLLKSSLDSARFDSPGNSTPALQLSQQAALFIPPQSVPSHFSLSDSSIDDLVPESHGRMEEVSNEAPWKRVSDEQQLQPAASAAVLYTDTDSEKPPRPPLENAGSASAGSVPPTPSSVLASLSAPMVARLARYLSARDVLALSQTCRAVHQRFAWNLPLLRAAELQRVAFVAQQKAKAETDDLIALTRRMYPSLDLQERLWSVNLVLAGPSESAPQFRLSQLPSRRVGAWQVSMALFYRDGGGSGPSGSSTPANGHSPRDASAAFRVLPFVVVNESDSIGSRYKLPTYHSSFREYGGVNEIFSCDLSDGPVVLMTYVPVPRGATVFCVASVCKDDVKRRGGLTSHPPRDSSSSSSDSAVVEEDLGLDEMPVRIEALEDWPFFEYVEGEWLDCSAGGSQGSGSSFYGNPVFKVSVPRGLSTTHLEMAVLLTQRRVPEDSVPGQMWPYPYYIGFYVASERLNVLQGVTRFKNSWRVCARLDLTYPRHRVLYIAPCTYNAGETTSFTLDVYANFPVSIQSSRSHKLSKWRFPK